MELHFSKLSLHKCLLLSILSQFHFQEGNKLSPSGKKPDDKFHIQISYQQLTEANFVSWQNDEKNYYKKNQSKFELNHFKNKKATLRHLTIIFILFLKMIFKTNWTRIIIFFFFNFFIDFEHFFLGFFSTFCLFGLNNLIAKIEAMTKNFPIQKTLYGAILSLDQEKKHIVQKFTTIHQFSIALVSCLVGSKRFRTHKNPFQYKLIQNIHKMLKSNI